MTDEIKPSQLPTTLPEPVVKTGQLTVAVKTPPPAGVTLRDTWPRWFWIASVCLALAAAGLWYLQPWATKKLAVAVETVAPATLIRVLAVNGRIAPQHLVAVKPQVSGRITAVTASEGAVVRQGDVLARIDGASQQAMVRQAVAGLDAALVGQSQAAANLARAVALGDTISRKALEDAQAARRTSDQEVARVTAVLDQAKIALDTYTVRAPISGTVLTRDVEEGQNVDPTKAMFSMADPADIVVEADVDEIYASLMVSGLRAVLLLKGEAQRRDGSVSFVAPQVDAATGGLAVKMRFDQPVRAPIGLTVTANIIVQKVDDAFAVPRSAIQRDSTDMAVFVALDGHAQRRVVTIVDWPAERVQVTQGLATGDVVITDATGLSDGLAVAASVAAKSVP